MFDLMISVKLFLGRFDMRTMQVSAVAALYPYPALIRINNLHQGALCCQRICHE
jgi:hypothetical protein